MTLTYRTIQVERELSNPAGSISSSKQHQSDHIAHGCVQLSFEYLQGWKFHDLYKAKREVLHLRPNNQSRERVWGLSSWRSALLQRPRGSCWAVSWAWASCVPWQQQSQTTSSSASAGVWAADWGLSTRKASPYWVFVKPYLEYCLEPGHPHCSSEERNWQKQRGSSRRLVRKLQAAEPDVWGKVEGTGFELVKSEGPGGSNDSIPVLMRWLRWVKEVLCSQACVGKGQEATGRGCFRGN